MTHLYSIYHFHLAQYPYFDNVYVTVQYNSHHNLYLTTMIKIPVSFFHGRRFALLYYMYPLTAIMHIIFILNLHLVNWVSKLKNSHTHVLGIFLSNIISLHIFTIMLYSYINVLFLIIFSPCQILWVFKGRLEPALMEEQEGRWRTPACGFRHLYVSSLLSTSYRNTTLPHDAWLSQACLQLCLSATSSPMGVRNMEKRLWKHSLIHATLQSAR